MLQLPKGEVFRDRLKESKDSPGRQSLGGRSFNCSQLGTSSQETITEFVVCSRDKHLLDVIRIGPDMALRCQLFHSFQQFLHYNNGY